MSKENNGQGTLNIAMADLTEGEAGDVLDARLGRVSVRQSAVKKERPPNNWANDAFADSETGTMVDPSSGAFLPPKNSGTFVLGEVDPDDDWDKKLRGKRGSPGIVINMPEKSSTVALQDSAPQAPPRPVTTANDDLRIWFPIAGAIVGLILLIIILLISL